jgi:hypothetical protein
MRAFRFEKKSSQRLSTAQVKNHHHIDTNAQNNIHEQTEQVKTLNKFKGMAATAPAILFSRSLFKTQRSIRTEVTREWRRLHDKKLHALYSSPSIIRVIKSRRLRWAGHVARMGERRGAYRVLVGKPEGRRPLERPRRRWDDNIKMDLQEVGWEGARTGSIWLRIGTGGGLL